MTAATFADLVALTDSATFTIMPGTPTEAVMWTPSLPTIGICEVRELEVTIARPMSKCTVRLLSPIIMRYVGGQPPPMPRIAEYQLGAGGLSSGARAPGAAPRSACCSAAGRSEVSQVWLLAGQLLGGFHDVVADDLVELGVVRSLRCPDPRATRRPGRPALLPAMRSSRGAGRGQLGDGGFVIGFGGPQPFRNVLFSARSFRLVEVLWQVEGVVAAVSSTGVGSVSWVPTRGFGHGADLLALHGWQSAAGGRRCSGS